MTSWNIHKINADGRYGEIVNSFTDRPGLDAALEASKRAKSMHSQDGTNYAVTNNLVTVLDTRYV